MTNNLTGAMMRWSSAVLLIVAALTLVGSAILIFVNPSQMALAIAGIISAFVLWAFSDVVDSVERIAVSSKRSADLLEKRLQQPRKQPLPRQSRQAQAGEFDFPLNE